MDKIQYHFDVNKVINIKYVPEQLCTWFTWHESEPIKKFFGLINTGKFLPAGWVDNSQYFQRILSEAELIKKDYLVKGYFVYRKSIAVVTLSNQTEVSKNFETQEDCLNWIDELKDTTGKTFEII